MAYSYSLIRSTPLVPRFPSFGNLDEMYCSKAAAIPKRNTRAKLNHSTAEVTACSYDYELMAFNIITVYMISTLFPLLLCIRSGRFRSRPASFETGRPASKQAGGCESGRNIYIDHTTGIYIYIYIYIYISTPQEILWCKYLQNTFVLNHPCSIVSSVKKYIINCSL